MGISVLILALTACQGDGPSGTNTGDTTPTGPVLKVGLVTDIGGLDDRSFNFLANTGLERAKDELGVEEIGRAHV